MFYKNQKALLWSVIVFILIYLIKACYFESEDVTITIPGKVIHKVKSIAVFTHSNRSS